MCRSCWGIRHRTSLRIRPSGGHHRCRRRVSLADRPAGNLYAMQVSLPYLRPRGGGTIVNFGSSTAIEGNAAFGAYAMAKEAIRGLSRVAAREWGRYGIRVNVIVPNALSPAAEDFRDANPERFARMQARIPLGRVGDPEFDIGRAVVGLASDELTYMSAQTLMLTGGA